MDETRPNDILQRTAPQNIEAEKAVIGAMLMDKEAIEKALPRGTSQVVLAISRLATLMGHDKDWQETLSRHV